MLVQVTRPTYVSMSSEKVFPLSNCLLLIVFMLQLILTDLSWNLIRKIESWLSSVMFFLLMFRWVLYYQYFLTRNYFYGIYISLRITYIFCKVHERNFCPKCLYTAVIMKRMLDAILDKAAMDDKVISLIPGVKYLVGLLFFILSFYFFVIFFLFRDRENWLYHELTYCWYSESWGSKSREISLD